MHGGRDKRDQNPWDVRNRRDSKHRGCDEKNIPECKEHDRLDHARGDHHQLNQRRLRFPGKERGPALEKSGQRAPKREQIIKQTGVSRRIAGPRGFASHSAERD